MILSTNLIGKNNELEKINESHREALREIAQDESIWQYFSYSVASDKFDIWFDKILDKMLEGSQFTYVVKRNADKKIVGCTRYYEIQPENKRLTIGHTFYIQDMRGTGINTECKFLLLKNAFENMQMNRVEFTIDARNARSIAATKKIGATQEGILRQHIITKDNYVRDTVVLSIIQTEWPNIKTELQVRLR